MDVFIPRINSKARVSLVRQAPEFNETLSGYKQEQVNVSQCVHRPAFKVSIRPTGFLWFWYLYNI